MTEAILRQFYVAFALPQPLTQLFAQLAFADPPTPPGEDGVLDRLAQALAWFYCEKLSTITKLVETLHAGTTVDAF